MESNTLTIVGVLSGTSCDGISCAIVDLTYTGEEYSTKQRFFATYPWPEQHRQTLFKLFGNVGVTTQELSEANFMVGKQFGEAVNNAIHDAGMQRTDIHLVSSHGQTVWHNVVTEGKEARVTSTLQIGDLSVIAEVTGITTVGDFRTADVAAKGHGAPLTSTLDYKLLRPKTTQGVVWRALQNIGGIGNVTLLASDNSAPIAFDTGPGNVLLDWFAVKLSNGASKYDKDGEVAKKGTIHLQLLEKMQQHPYFQLTPPKTTGRELFTAQLGEQWLAEASTMGVDDASFMATLADLTAWSIIDAYQRFCPSYDQLKEVFVSGGGSENPFLMERLQTRLGTQAQVNSHDALGLSAEAKEAILFAFLGFLTILNRPGNISSCTHAMGPRVLGKIAPGPNWAQIQKIMCNSS